jgi:hypothetical protein
MREYYDLNGNLSMFLKLYSEFEQVDSCEKSTVNIIFSCNRSAKFYRREPFRLRP